MALTKNRQALSDYLVDFLRKEWEQAPYTNGVVFDTSLMYEFRFLRDGSEIELALYTYNVGREHVLNFDLEDGFVYCRSIRKGYTKDGEYQEVRFKLEFEAFKTTMTEMSIRHTATVATKINCIRSFLNKLHLN